MADAIETKGMEPLARSMNERLYGPRCPAAVITSVNRMMRETNPVGAAAAMRGRVERPDYREWLPAIDVPTFVCAGTADTWSIAEVTRRLTSCLRSPRTLLLSDIGHLPNLEAPDLFNHALVDFLCGADKE